MHKVKLDGKKAKEDRIIRKDNIEMDLKNVCRQGVDRLIWLRLETGRGLL